MNRPDATTRQHSRGTDAAETDTVVTEDATETHAIEPPDVAEPEDAVETPNVAEPEKAPRGGARVPAARAGGAGRLPVWLWSRPMMMRALAARDLATVYRTLGEYGYSKRVIGALAGQSPSQVSQIAAGRTTVADDVLARVADGLGIPLGYLGLAHDPDDTGGAAGGGSAGGAGAGRCERCAARPGVAVWTGLEVRALREVSRLSVRQFAAYLGVSDRMVSKWEAAGASLRPRPVNQAALDTALHRADEQTRRRFGDTLRQIQTTTGTADTPTPPG